MDDYFQYGNVQMLAAKMREMSMLRTKRNIEVYETLADLVGDVTQKFSPNIKLENVENLFISFVAFLALVSITSSLLRTHVFFKFDPLIATSPQSVDQETQSPTN